MWACQYGELTINVVEAIDNMNIKRFFKLTIRKIILWLPLNKHKVVFISFDGGNYSCNPKYIAEEMLKRKKFKIYWLYSEQKLNDFSDFPKGVKLVPMKTLSELYHLSTCGTIIANNRTAIWQRFNKKTGQLYIQTWHGNMCFKKIEADAPGLGQDYIQLAKQDSKNADYLLCGSKWRKKTCFEHSFFYDGVITEFGLPRNDILLSADKAQIKQKVCQKLNIPVSSNILIYAPTFRDSGSLQPYSLDYEKLYNILRKKFGGDWFIISRLHPNLASIDNVLPLVSYVVDGSKYPDMQELLMVSDLMITDYSGCAFDFMLTKRPIFLFATDIPEYTHERDFYFPLQSTPFPISETNQQLLHVIENFDAEKYLLRIEEYISQCGFYDTGTASIQCVNLIEARHAKQ